MQLRLRSTALGPWPFHLYVTCTGQLNCGKADDLERIRDYKHGKGKIPAFCDSGSIGVRTTSGGGKLHTV
jgi:hypothetical protein